MGCAGLLVVLRSAAWRFEGKAAWAAEMCDRLERDLDRIVRAAEWDGGLPDDLEMREAIANPSAWLSRHLSPITSA
jgi:hypothetical protein